MNYMRIKNFFILVGRLDDWNEDLEERIEFGAKVGRSRGFIRKDDKIIVITGWRQGKLKSEAKIRGSKSKLLSLKFKYEV